MRAGLVASATLLASLAVSGAWAATDDIALTFTPETGFVSLRLGDDAGDTVALAGRDAAGTPRLALIWHADGETRAIERALPADAVAIDAGASPGGDVLFVLCNDRVLRLDDRDEALRPVARVASIYRGRSYAPLTAALDFARDVDDDGVSELLVQDFDELTLIDGDGYERRQTLSLASTRRGFERAQTYRPARVAAAPASEPPALIAVRGNTTLHFTLAGDAALVAPEVRELALGLSSERDIERFYNGDPELDQRNVTLREPELLADINDDGLPDLVTLETRSSGVFDKQTTYRLHLGRDGGRFDATPDAAFSSEGYQFGLRTAELEPGRTALVAPGVRIGLRTLIGALFSRSVKLDIDIHAADASGRYTDEPSADVRAKVRFDFGSGEVELPTVTFGDVDGDGRRDLIIKRGRDGLGWQRNLGSGRFDDDTASLDIVSPRDGTNVHAADLDGDGADEVLVRYERQDGDALRRRLRVLYR